MKFKAWLPHLIEFKKRLMWSVSLVTILFCILLFFSQDLFNLIAKPLLNSGHESQRLIATHVTTPFTTPLKLAFFSSLLLSAPFLLYQFWAFIAPALYPTEKRMIRPILVISCCLLFIGMSFAYFVVCPMALGFFQSITPSSVMMMTDMHYYLDFVLALTLSFGACFQVPLVTYILLKTRLLKIEQLKKKRPHVIVAAFTIGMILTPPDVISQIMLALPLWGLFELGVGVYQWQHRKREILAPFDI
ncbi:MAG: twin-arginine translocase subunit TatC [Gammaproteobacteria bacterium]